MQTERLSPLIGSRYRLEAQLGRGGMGVVYRATDQLTGEEVALKRVTTPAEQLQFASRLASDSAASESTHLRLALAQEFHTLASLRHPNVIRVLDYGFDDQRQPYLTMDLLHEPRTLLEAGRGQPLEVKVNLLVQTLQALAYLHRRAVIHRDLKPDNVAVVVEEGQPRVRVLDFGLALSMTDSLNARSQGMAGTLAYMSPEVLQGDEASEASDLYAVGVMAFELLTGEHPFSASTTVDLINKILKTEPDLTPLLALMPPQASETLIVYTQGEARATLPEIVARLLAKRPAERYRDAYAVIADLCAALDVPPPEESDAIRESFLQAARFVGRDPELRALREALMRARDGAGSLWLIGGESGVGKSRLIEELRKSALIEGVLTLRGQAVASGALPFQVWREPLRRLILSTDLSRDEASVLATLLPEIDAPPFSGDAHESLSNLIIDLFERQNAPVVLLLEDLQWAGEGLDALKQLAAYVEALPLLIVASFRDDERPRLPEALPQAHLLALTRLAPDEIARLTASMLGAASARTDVIDFLQRETEGNAFFLVETVRALAEEAGSLNRVGRETLPERLFTGGMQQVIWRRINRVPASVRDLLRLAAVIGRDLDLRLLRYVLDAGTQDLASRQSVDLEEWVTICANRAVFEAHEGGWRFAHDKLREALLDALTPDERAADHREAAEALEAVYADPDRYAPALARHWREAGDPGREAPYVLIAAKQAYDNGVYPEARHLYMRALEIRAFAAADNPTAREAEILRLLGDTFYYTGEYDQAREQQRASLALYQSIGDRKGISDAITGLGEADMRQGLLDQAEAAFQEAQEIRLELGLTREVGYGYMNLGVIETERERWDRARDLFKQSLDCMEQGGTPRDLARALNNYGAVLDALGDKTAAHDYYQRSLAIREQIHDLQGVCYSYNNLGALAYDLGNYDEARALLEQSLRLARQIVDRLALSSNLSMLGDLCLKQRELDAARDYYQQALDLRRQIEDRSGIVASTRALGDLAREIADADGALMYYYEALALSFEYSLTAQVWNTLHEYARLLMGQGRSRPALKLLAAVRAHRDTPNPEDQALINQLEAQMPPNASASALALGAALTLDDVRAKVDRGDLEF